jgi:hypothetical protein
LEEGKQSRDIDLERGFAQGDGPSPRLYNVGEQILLFRLEYDPEIAGIYLTFLIPRTVVNNETVFPRIESAEAAGLVVDNELKHTNRRIPSFADDATGGFDRSARNLAYVKEILQVFGRMCGLETNVDKTTLMPVGCLNDPVGHDVLQLGFEIVTEIKCLGLIIDNRASNLEQHFDGTIRKIRQLIGSWERYNLTLMGRICVAKTMLISQIGYIGCIVTPTANQISTLQNLIDGYVTRGIVVAKDRLYNKPTHGGLGLINIELYITALQCSWVRRCYTVLNDPWRWRLAESCNFWFENLHEGKLDPVLYPIEHNILTSFIKFRAAYYTMNENFLQANIVDNPLFSRGNPGRVNRGRGNPGRLVEEPGLVDRIFLGQQFYADHEERLLGLKMKSLIVDGRVSPYPDLLITTGIPFTQATYFRLITVGNFAVQKYADKENSNGTSIELKMFMCGIKKGSKKFRKVLGHGIRTTKVEDLRVVQTFFRLVGSDIPDPAILGRLHTVWTWNFLSNRIRFFSFQFLNNSLGTKSRIAARYRNGGNIIDERCTFCVRSGSMVPMREEFAHVFYDCPYIRPLCDRAYDIYFRHRLDDAQKKLCYLTGIVETLHKNDSTFYILTATLINYTIWQWKQKKMIPSIATLLNEVDYGFYMICYTSRKIENMAVISTTPICRRWRDGQYGRG